MNYAGRIFYERGIRKVTVEELCAGLSISKRTFYKYFAGRDVLAEAVMLERFAAYGPKIFENLNSSAPVDQVLETHFDLLMNKLFGHVSMQMFADFQDLFPETWEKIESIRKEIISMFAGLLERGQQDGLIRRDVDPVVVGKIMQGVVSHLANPQFLLAAGLDMEAFIRNWQNICMHGLLLSVEQDK